MYLFFRERGREEEKETNIDGVPLARSQLGAWPTTQACALTGKQTNNPSVLRPALSPLSHTRQSSKQFWKHLLLTYYIILTFNLINTIES